MHPTRLGPVQFREHVRVVAGDAEGHSGRTLGQAELVTPKCAVMRLGVREPTPSLPLHVVLVPVAAGGGRGEHDTTTAGPQTGRDGQQALAAPRTIAVVEVLPSEDGSGDVALKLAEGAFGRVSARSSGARSGSGSSASPTQVASLAPQLAGIDNWLCRKFPRFCD